MQSVSQLIIEQLTSILPATFTRREACRHLGGLFTPGGLANLDCEGAGPPRVRAGRAVLYEKQSFLAWLEGRFSEGGSHV